MENHNVTSCADFPGSGSIAFSSIKVTGSGNSALTPSFGLQRLTTACSTNVSTTASRTTITWSP